MNFFVRISELFSDDAHFERIFSVFRGFTKKETPIDRFRIDALFGARFRALAKVSF